MYAGVELPPQLPKVQDKSCQCLPIRAGGPVAALCVRCVDLEGFLSGASGCGAGGCRMLDPGPPPTSTNTTAPFLVDDPISHPPFPPLVLRAGWVGGRSTTSLPCLTANDVPLPLVTAQSREVAAGHIMPQLNATFSSHTAGPDPCTRSLALAFCCLVNDKEKSNSCGP